MIEVIDLTKKYSGNTALDGITFRAEKGEILGLLGPNGAGKSTTMNIITGYIEAGSGTVSVDGVELSSNPKEVKRKIGYLPEIPPLYTDMTVKGYLKFVCELKGVKGDKKAHIAEVIEMAKIEDVSGRIIKNLSKGYRQRVGIAQALIGDPEILIFDEPTVGLDPAQIIEIRELIKQLGENHTVILSSHILSEISSVCDRVIVLNKGKIVADLKTEELSSAFSKGQRLRLVIEGPREKIIAALKSVKGVRSAFCTGDADEKNACAYSLECKEGQDVKRGIFKAMVAADCPILKMDEEELSLEHLFLQLTGGKKK